MERVVTFNNAGLKMYGIVHEPEIIPGAFNKRLGVLILHSGRQARRGPHNFYVKVARALCAAGFYVMRYDNRGYGDSEGTEHQTAEAWFSDALYAMEFFHHSFGLEKLILWGLCGGAVLAIHCASRWPDTIDSIILCNLFYKIDIASYRGEFKTVYRKLLTFSFWRKMLSASPIYYIRKGVPNVKRRFMKAFFPSRYDKSFEESALPYMRSLPETFSKVSKPTLFIFATEDPIFANFEEELFENPAWSIHLEGIPIRLSVIEGADHNFSSLPYEQSAIKESVDWAFNQATNARHAFPWKGLQR
jgi:pimeloyl-ACP methyl ester carboxylesterase